ncbi:Crp/Fnr family transcriptional regulator [Hypericibacter adhaerens]|uniref:Crp/Fnr family transcriptional regulator n=1 Tax=Hypericibacter adhaerens TaxID=2602016 RepID=A0A5J6N045_9PROT|nr:Crp/Fnr family transcriptional regulator [Hypericibacter adhaerens]QEX23051.1 Crp/Fnr family transcriptional regulator [Hypericibacter adhaerens]
MISTSSQFSNRSQGYRPGAAAFPASPTPALDCRDLETQLPEAKAGQRRELKPGESLFLQEDRIDSVYVLLEGWAFRYQDLKDGRRQIVDFALPGDVVGLNEAANAPYGIEALTGCVFACYSRKSFFALVGRQPAMGLALVQMLARAEARAIEHLTSLGRRTARERVAHLLLELVTRLNRLNLAADSKSLDLPLMLSHVADALGLANETVCRCLSSLRKDGVLVLRERRLKVLDLRRLTEEANLSEVEDDETAVTAAPVRRFAA